MIPWLPHQRAAFLDLFSDLWPGALTRRGDQPGELVKMWLQTAERYRHEIAIAALRQVKESQEINRAPTFPAFTREASAMSVFVNKAHAEKIQEREYEARGPVRSAREIADDDTFWEELREPERYGEEYARIRERMRQGLMPLREPGEEP